MINNKQELLQVIESCTQQVNDKFNGNGGKLVSGVEEQKVVDASQIVPPVYEKAGYQLTWDVDIRVIDGNTEINAVWVACKYKQKRAFQVRYTALYHTERYKGVTNATQKTENMKNTHFLKAA